MGGTKKAELSLLLKVDEQTAERSRRKMRELQAANQQLVDSQSDQARSAGRQADALGEVNAATRANINTLRQGFTHARQEIINRQQNVKLLAQEAVERQKVTQAATRQMHAEMDALRSASYGGVRSGTRPTGRTGGGGSRAEAAGDVSTGLSSLAGVAGGGAIGGALRLAADITGAAEQMPRLISGLRGLAGASTAVEGASLAGAGGLASLAAAAAPLAVVAAAAAGAFLLVESALKKGAAAADAYIARIERTAEIDNLTEAEERLSEIRNEEAALVKKIDQAEADRAATLQLLLKTLTTTNPQTSGYNILQLISFIHKLDTTTKGFHTSLKGLEIELSRLTGMINEGKFDQEKRAHEDLSKAANNTKKAHQDLSKQTVTVADVTETAARSLSTATHAERQRTESIEQSTKAVVSADQQIRQLQMTLPQRMAEVRKGFDSQFKSLAERASDIQRQSEGRRLEIIRGANRDEEREQRRSQMERAASEARFRLDQRELAADRDFAGLARLRDQKALDDQLGKAREQFDKQERGIAIQQQIEDARLSAGQQLVDLERERGRVLLDLAEQERRVKLEQIRDLLSARGLSTTYYDQQLNGGMAAAAANLPKNLLRAGVPVKRALGGPLAAHQSAIVNEGYRGQREAFNGALLPAGPGIFTPMVSGRVTNTSSPVYNITINESRTPQLTWREIERKLNERDRQTYG